MEKKFVRFLPNFIIKQCHNFKCNRNEFHTILGIEIATNYSIIKCLSCGFKSKLKETISGDTK